MNYLQSSSFIYLCKINKRELKHNSSIDIYHFLIIVHTLENLYSRIYWEENPQNLLENNLITVDIVTSIFQFLCCF